MGASTEVDKNVAAKALESHERALATGIFLIPKEAAMQQKAHWTGPGRPVEPVLPSVLVCLASSEPKTGFRGSTHGSTRRRGGQGPLPNAMAELGRSNAEERVG